MELKCKISFLLVMIQILTLARLLEGLEANPRSRPSSPTTSTSTSVEAKLEDERSRDSNATADSSSSTASQRQLTSAAQRQRGKSGTTLSLHHTVIHKIRYYPRARRTRDKAGTGNRNRNVLPASRSKGPQREEVRTAGFSSAQQNNGSSSSGAEVGGRLRRRTTSVNYIGSQPQKISVNLPSFISSSSRLKRQLQGIFHLSAGGGDSQFSPTSTTIPILPSKKSKSTTTNPVNTHRRWFPKLRTNNNSNSRDNGLGLMSLSRRNNGNNADDDQKSEETAKKEIDTKDGEGIGVTIANSPKMTSIKRKKMKKYKKRRSFAPLHAREGGRVESNGAEKIIKAIPINISEQDGNGKRNYSVEIVEFTRKTVIKGNDKKSNKEQKQPNNQKLVIKEIINNNNNNNNGGFVPMIKVQSLGNDDQQQPTPVVPIFKANSPPVLSNLDATATPRRKLRRRRPRPFKFNLNKSNNNDNELVKADLVAEKSIENSPPANNDDSSKSINGNHNPSPIGNSLPNFPRGKLPIQKSASPVKVAIPYHDKEVDEQAWKAYLDGHSTFGAKGDFKHVIKVDKVNATNSPSIPVRINNSNTNNNNKNNHNFPPRAPLHRPKFRNPVRSNPPKPTHIPEHRTQATPVLPEAGNNPPKEESVTMEKADVKLRRDSVPKTTIYTATGKTIKVSEDGSPEEAQDDDKSKENSVFEYSSGKVDVDIDSFPRLSKSTLDQLYKQGHPAVAKAPGVTYKAPSFQEAFSGFSNSGGHDYNPFRLNPLKDAPPLKFDPESDSFYGNPTPDRLAQSNRQNPIQVQNDSPPGSDYQETNHRDDDQPPPISAPPTTNNALVYHNREQNDVDEDARNHHDDNPDRRGEHHLEVDEDPRGHGDEEQGSYIVSDEDSDEPESFYDRVYEPPEYRRAYEPSDYDYNPYYEDEVEEVDQFIKEFVSLQNNFERQLPPRASEEREEFVGGDPSYFGLQERERQEDFRDRRRRPGRANNHDYEVSQGEREDSFPEYGTNDYETSGVDFDPSYVDALRQFDEEIKRMQESERDSPSSTTAARDPPQSTGEPPLVITSPGPAVSYLPRGTAPRPMQVTTPHNFPQEDPSDDSKESKESEEEEFSSLGGNSPGGKSGRDSERELKVDESRRVRVRHVERVSDSSRGPREVYGSLDDDIRDIEREFRFYRS